MAPPGLEGPRWALKAAEPLLKAEMRQTFDQINISDAAVSVCEMRPIKSERSRLPNPSTGAGPVRSPQSRLPRAEALLPKRRSASIIHPAAAPSSPARPMAAGLLRPLSASHDAALVGFDVSIDTEEPRTEP